MTWYACQPIDGVDSKSLCYLVIDCSFHIVVEFMDRTKRSSKPVLIPSHLVQKSKFWIVNPQVRTWEILGRIVTPNFILKTLFKAASNLDDKLRSIFREVLLVQHIVAAENFSKYKMAASWVKLAFANNLSRIKVGFMISLMIAYNKTWGFINHAGDIFTCWLGIKMGKNDCQFTT